MPSEMIWKTASPAFDMPLADGEQLVGQRGRAGDEAVARRVQDRSAGREAERTVANGLADEVAHLLELARRSRSSSCAASPDT